MGRSRAGARPAARRGWASARGDQGPTRSRPPDADPIRVDTRVLADYIADSIVRKLDGRPAAKQPSDIHSVIRRDSGEHDDSVKHPDVDQTLR